MDRFDAMRLFVRIVERRSFTAAANDMEIPRSTATKVIAEMEARLGVRLLQRTTRVVRPTLDGELFHQPCMRILDDVDDAEGGFRGVAPKGLLRVDVQGTLARHFLLPGLPAFFARYPQIQLVMSESDRWVDLVEEGIDCVLRYGPLRDGRWSHAAWPCSNASPAPRRNTCNVSACLRSWKRWTNTAWLACVRSPPAWSRRWSSRPPRGCVPSHCPARSASPGPKAIWPASGLAWASRRCRASMWRTTCSKARWWKSCAIPRRRQSVSLLYSRARQLSPRVRVFLDWAAGEFAKQAGVAQPIG